jgi:CheY-like chemotaxis protein
MTSGARETGGTTAPDQLRILVGVPTAAERGRVSAILRAEGHHITEVADARELRAKLDELERAGKPPDVIICAGILAENDDPVLTMRLAGNQTAPPRAPSAGG